MAKQTSGINGGYRGKVGNVVGYMWRGQWCVRSKPRDFHDAKTEKQLEQRAFFKASVDYAGRMKEILRVGFHCPALAVHKTECNYFLMVNKRCLSWDSETLAVDYENLRVSEGPVAPVAFTSIERGMMSNELVIGFEKNPEHRNCNSSDKVYVAAICASRGEAMLSLPVYRRMRSITVPLPSAWEGEEVHLYGFVQDYAGRCSESMYISLQGDGLDTADAVEGGADDAAGIAGTLAAGVESGELGVLKGDPVAGDAHRRRRAAFDG